MSKAFEIAQERLAKGEITKEEYDEIVQALSQASTNSSEDEPPKTAPTSDAKGSGAGIVGIIVLVFVLIVILMLVWSGIKIGLNA